MERNPSNHFPTDEEMKAIVAEALTEPTQPLTVEQQHEDKDIPSEEREIAAWILKARNEGQTDL